MTTLVAVLLTLLPACQGEAAKPNPWKSDYKLTLEKKGDEHVFVIEGTTNVPDETQLRARVYAVEVVQGFNGPREDEEPLVWEDDGGQPSFRVLELKAGRFREEVYRFRKKPYSLHYRARLHYIPRQQTSPEVLKKLGEDDFTFPAELKVGGPKELALELAGEVKGISEDLEALDGLYREIKRKFAEHRKQFDKGAWDGWKLGWVDRVQRLAESNNERYNLWAVWMERQARMRVGGMSELLLRMAGGCTDFFVQPMEEKDREAFLTRLQELIEGFHAYYEEAVDVMGVPIPLDAEKIAPLIAAYEAACAPLRKWLEKGEGDPQALRDGARRAGLEALLQLPPLLKNRKTAYSFVNDISSRFRRLLDLVETKADGETLKKALADHDEAVRNFKKLAELK